MKYETLAQKGFKQNENKTHAEYIQQCNLHKGQK